MAYLEGKAHTFDIEEPERYQCSAYCCLFDISTRRVRIGICQVNASVWRNVCGGAGFDKRYERCKILGILKGNMFFSAV